MRIFENTSFKFVQARKIAYVLSGILLLASIGAIVGRGIQYGIDFKGGKEFVIETNQELTVTKVRNALTAALGSQPEVKRYGANTDLLIRTDSELELNQLQSLIKETVSATGEGISAEIVKTDIVGPRFAEDLKTGALYSIIFAIIIIFMYILLRFRNWTFSAGAVAALIHDVLLVLGLFTMLQGVLPFELSIDQAMIAGFLTIVGYSLNDTVVVFDRIRENKLLFKAEVIEDLVNRSVNDTLSRTVITSGTTLFVVAVLFIFGGEVLKGLSFALILGIISGTYSSIFIASSLYVDLTKRFSRS